MKTALVASLAVSAAGLKLTDRGVSAHKYGKLGECKGDCDNDNQCKGNLKCYQRQGAWSHTKVTGCEGLGKNHWDYCFKLPTAAVAATNSKILTDYSANAHQAGKLGECKGDCDSDAQCNAGLRCFQRNGYTGVTNCKGRGAADFDYCYKPNEVSTDKKILTDDGVSAHLNGKLGKCRGDCDNDSQCKGNLKCYQRQGAWSHTAVTGCEGLGTKDWDYCFELPTAAVAATNSKTLTDYSANAHQAGKLGECKGDCDNDNQCSGDLRCFQRNGYTGVTNCKGRGAADFDYCYMPEVSKDAKKLTNHGVSAHTLGKLGKCKGDCDNDNQCKGNLKCYQRGGAYSHTAVTGCEGLGTKNWDYCFELPTAAVAATNAKTLTDYGDLNAHQIGTRTKLGECKGDCDNDNQCSAGLKCFQRNGFTGVTNCKGRGAADFDYCFNPIPLSDPTRCAEWACADWCAYWDEAAENSGIYKTNGCGDDGIDTCNCN